VFSLIASSSAAQWIQHPTPGIPRTPDGKPDLTAPAPKTRDGKPDLSGMWAREGDDRYYNNAAADLKPADVKPWAQELYERRLADLGRDSMEVQCLPLGPAAITMSRSPSTILARIRYRGPSRCRWSSSPTQSCSKPCAGKTRNPSRTFPSRPARAGRPRSKWRERCCRSTSAHTRLKRKTRSQAP